RRAAAISRRARAGNAGRHRDRRSPRVAAAGARALGARLAREAFAQLQLPELAGRGARHAVDHLVAIGQLPLREAVPEQVLAEHVGRFGGRDGSALLPDDARQRPLAPLRVGDRDHRRLGDLRVRHQRVLEVDRRDPFAARLDQVLGAVGDADEAELVHRRDVAGAQPPSSVNLSSLGATRWYEPVMKGPRTWISPTLLPSHGASLPSSARILTSTNGTGTPAIAARRKRSASGRLSLRTAVVAKGEVSVIPQP